MLTVEQVEQITVDVTLGRPLRVKGREAVSMAKKIRKDIKAMAKDGLVPSVPHEMPDQPDS